jgi:hypothetical protein
LNRIYLALRMRERIRGCPSPSLGQDRVRALLDAHGYSSAMNGEPLTLQNAALTRRNDALPFNAETNYMFISKRECRALGVKRWRGLLK